MSSGGAVAGGSGAQLDTGQSNAVLIVNGEHVQQCKYGGRAQANGADGGAFFAPDDPRAYPHAATLDTCATMHGAGPKKARWASQWTRAAWPEAASFVVNSSPRCCDACRMKLRRVVQAASGEAGGKGKQPAAHGARGGGKGKEEDTGGVKEEDVIGATALADLCQDVICRQLLARVASLQRTCAVASHKLAR